MIKVTIEAKINLQMIFDEGVTEEHLSNIIKAQTIDLDDIETVSAFINEVADLWTDFQNNNGGCSSYVVLSRRDGNRKVGGYKTHI